PRVPGTNSRRTSRSIRADDAALDGECTCARTSPASTVPMDDCSFLGSVSSSSGHHEAVAGRLPDANSEHFQAVRLVRYSLSSSQLRSPITSANSVDEVTTYGLIASRPPLRAHPPQKGARICNRGFDHAGRLLCGKRDGLHDRAFGAAPAAARV